MDVFEKLCPWIAPLRDGKLKEAIYEYVVDKDYVTFAEIIRDIERATTQWLEGVELRGDMRIERENNVVLWAGMSAAFCDALRELVRDRKIHYEQASIFTYLMDGGVLTYPVAKRPPRNGYKHPHWQPVYLRPVQNSAGVQQDPTKVKGGSRIGG